MRNDPACWREQFEHWDDLIKQPGILLSGHVLSGGQQHQLLRTLFSAGNTPSIKHVLAHFEQKESGGVLRTLHWLIKVGLLRVHGSQK
jgi:hypothetical protein